MSKDSQSWMNSLTGISRTELSKNSKKCSPSKLNIEHLKREDVIFYEGTPNVREGLVFYIFTNFQGTPRSVNLISYEIYDAKWDKNAKLIWTDRDNYVEYQSHIPIAHHRHQYVLMGNDSLKKIDDEFMQKGIRLNLMNWDGEPWSDLK